MCLFCDIEAGRVPAHFVMESPDSVAFLDIRPIFPGHVLVIPRAHYETLADLPEDLIQPLFSAAQKLARAVLAATDAHGTFVAMNNKVSQSVPHLHVHVVPRRFKDGLRGFFWPRRKYDSDEAMASMAESIRSHVDALESA